MDKTASNEKTQKKNKNSDKKAEEIKVTGQLAAALKREWEELAKRQEQRGIKVSSKNKIRSVSLTKNQHGKISVRVNMENGTRLFDNAKEHNVDKFKARAESVYRRSKIEELLKKIKEYGYAAVEGEIPAELKEAVLKSMEKANISTSYKGEKAEAEAARQAAQNAADNAAKSFANNPKNDRSAYRDGFGELTVNARPGEHKYTITETPALKQLLNNGTAIILPPVQTSVPKSIMPLVEEQVGKTVDLAAQSAQETVPDMTELAVNRLGSSSVTVTTKDGRKIKGDAATVGTSAVYQDIVLKDIEKARQNDQDALKRLNVQLSILKHNRIIPQDATEITADHLDNVENFVRTHPNQIKRKGINLSKEERQQVNSAKEKEKALRAEQEANGDHEKNKQICQEIAKTPSLISEIMTGNKKISDYTARDITEDLRTHINGGYEPTQTEKEMAQILAMRQQNKEAPLSEEALKDAIKIFENCHKTKGSGIPLHALLKTMNGQGGPVAKDVSEKAPLSQTPKVSKEQKDAQKAAAKAQKEALLDPNNSESAEKIRQAKAVLEKENKGEELTEREKQLSDFIHRTYKNIENLKSSDLDDPKNTKQLAQVLQCKKLFSGKPKETVAPSKNAEKAPPVNNGVEKQPAAVSQPKQQTQSNETEAERVKNRIKENMLAYKASSEKIVAHAEQKTEKVGLQQKLQQEAKNPNTSSRQQAPSPAVQAALLKKKEGLVR